MKATIIILSLFSNLLFSQYITGLSVTQNGTDQIKANLKAYLPTSGEYLSSNTTINQNTITLSVCYFMTDFGAVSNLSNDFQINIPSNHNYSLVVNMYSSNSSTSCNYQNIEDTATLNFPTPIQGTISLSTNENNFNEQGIGLFPIPAKDQLNIRTTEKVERINIFDTSGKKLPATLENNKINISNLRNGTYFIEIFTEKRRFHRKFTVQK